MPRPPKFLYGITQQEWLVGEMIQAARQNKKDCNESVTFQQSMKELNVNLEEALERAYMLAALDELLKYYSLTPRVD